MKTLKTIQGLAKAGRIISKIIFILCLVGGIGCIVGIVCLAAIPDSFKLGGLTVHGIIETSGEVSMGTCYAAMAVGAVLCAGEAVLCKISENCFRYQVDAGTPFTFEGAKRLITLGVCAIAIPIGTSVIAAIVFAIMSAVFADTAKLDLSSASSVGIGIMLIVTGLLCRCGAEAEYGKLRDGEAAERSAG